MEEVNLYAARWGFYPRYTVYRIADSAKRILSDSTAPVFQKKVHGAGEWVTIAASGYEVWYGVGYIVLSTALNSDDTVQCLSGKYMSPTLMVGCAERKLDKKRNQQECTVYGDTAISRRGTLADWASSLTALVAKLCSELTTTGGLSNSHIRLIHEAGGVAGDLMSLEISAPSGGDPIAVSVVDQAITLAPPTGATAIQCIAALNNSAAVAALHCRAEVPAGEDGSGAIGAFSHTHLAGGADAIDFDTLQGLTVLFQFYSVYSTGDMMAGFGNIESIDWQGAPSDLLKAGLSVSGAKYPLRHVIE
jgi:hypothetical protein